MAFAEIRQLRRAFFLQKRIIGALFMREFMTRWGRRNLGFAWLFAEPLVFAIPVIFMWSMIRAPFEHGLPMIAFVWTGYMPILMFRHVTGHSIYTIKSNASMLYHRQVTPLDLFIGRQGLELMGNLSASAMTFLLFYLLGLIDWPHDYGLFLLGFFYMSWWSIAVALVVAALSERSEIVEHVWQPISYMYLPFCGFFYMAAWLPPSWREMALAAVPSLHAYEMIRGGLFGDRVETFYDISYLSWLLSIVTLIGLWALRDVRKHLVLE
jgi:capsular polysaccharide transport system permease protein